MSETPPKKRYRNLFPKTLGACVEPLTRPVFKAQGIATSRLIQDWEKIIGAQLASRCFPQKITYGKGKNTDGHLIIAVENGFATDVQYHIPNIIERLAGYFGYKAVSRISIVPIVNAALKKSKTVKKPILPKQSAHLLEIVDDDELKAVLVSFADCLSSPQT